MENTLLIGDYLLVDKLRYGGNSFTDLFMPYKQVHRGDVIVFRYPVHPTQHFVKRVVGVPGRPRPPDQPAGVTSTAIPCRNPTSAIVPACTTLFATSSLASTFPFPAWKEAGGWR